MYGENGRLNACGDHRTLLDETASVNDYIYVQNTLIIRTDGLEQTV